MKIQIFKCDLCGTEYRGAGGKTVSFKVGIGKLKVYDIEAGDIDTVVKYMDLCYPCISDLYQIEISNYNMYTQGYKLQYLIDRGKKCKSS